MDDDNELIQQQEEEQLIDSAFQELLDVYLSSKHRKKVELITRAFNFARQAHRGVRRHSGEPYIMHPIAVARIVAEEIGLGSTSICAALLHDVVEDTDYTVEDIRNIFGDKIAQIVDGLTKIAGGIFGDKASAQAENFKKLLLTMSEDIRVILIKIADRLHNMRTLGSMPVNKQYKIAGETLYIYAPLAYRLGLNKIKTELENLSFRYEHPEEFEKIQQKLEVTRSQRDILFEEFTRPIIERLDAMGLHYEIKGRVKSPYSIWKKMQTKKITFEEIYDILAVRIVFDPSRTEREANECFDIYLALSQIYSVHPDRFRDWINHPKSNGYQALHATLMSRSGNWVEVQIRSRRMDDIDEQGVAAHWKYKAESSKRSDDSEAEQLAEENDAEMDRWLHTIKEILDDPQPDAMDFLSAINLNLYASEIFVFTPKGDIITMPQGSTALDFAFQIHTVLGTHCIGAKVNHKLVPVSYVLQSGDQVEILSSRTQHIDPAWLDMVSTAKAKNKIKAGLRREQRVAMKEGEVLLNEFAAKAELALNSTDIDKICQLHGLDSRDSLLLALGQKNIILGEAERNAVKGGSLFSKIFGSSKKSSAAVRADKDVAVDANGKATFDKSKPLLLTDDDIHSKYRMAECCNPIAGDDVLGFLTDDGNIVIHKRECAEAARLKAAYGNRIVAARWSTHKVHYFLSTIALSGIDSLGVLNQITEVLSRQLNVNIERILIEVREGLFEGTIRLRVHDVEDVKQIIRNLKQISAVTSVSRTE